MQETFQYRPHISAFRKIMPFVLGILAVLQFVIGTIMVQTIPFISIVFYTLGTIILVEAVVIHIVMRRMEAVRIQLTDEELVYTNRKGSQRVPYAKIIEVKYPSIRYMGGWIRIQTAEQTFRMTVVMKELPKLLDMLKQQLTVHDNIGAMDTQGYFSFYKTVTYSDQSWDRLYEIGPKLFGLTITTTLIGVLFEILFPLHSIFDSLRLFLYIAYPAAIYIVTEILFAIQVAREASTDDMTVPQRNQEYERTVYRYSLVGGGVALIAFIGIHLIG